MEMKGDVDSEGDYAHVREGSRKEIQFFCDSNTALKRNKVFFFFLKKRCLDHRDVWPRPSPLTCLNYSFILILKTLPTGSPRLWDHWSQFEITIFQSHLPTSFYCSKTDRVYDLLFLYTIKFILSKLEPPQIQWSTHIISFVLKKINS